MSEYLIIAFKTLLFLTIILIIIRIMGKRELGELNVFDIIVSFMISEIFSNAIADPKSNIFLSLLPIFIIFVVQITISFLVLKSKRIRSILESKPSLIINNGVIDYEEMKKQRYNISDLTQQIREFGIDDLTIVAFAILENNGELSVIKKDDSNLKFPFPIINDGKLEHYYLKQANISYCLIEEKLKKLNCTVNDIFMGFIDKDDELIVFSKKSNNIK